MSISGVSSAGSSATAPSATTDSAIAQVQKQITALQKEIRDENNGKDDATTKAKLVQTYTTELLALELKLAQLQLEKTGSATKTTAKVPAAGEPGTQTQTVVPPETSMYLNEVA